MNLKQFGALLSVFTVLGVNAIATKALTQEASIQFGQAISQGSCTIETGEDGRTLAIAFQDFQSANGKRNRCVLRVNTTIPSGFNVQFRFVYQGITEVPSGGNASLSRSYTFLGSALGIVEPEPKTTKFTSSNPLFQEQDDLTVASASCGGQGQLGMNVVAASSQGSSIFVDKFKINIELIPCSLK